MRTQVSFEVAGEIVRGSVVAEEGGGLRHGILMVHGWRGNEMKNLDFAKTFARLGAVCMTINLRGHGTSEGNRDGKRDMYTAADHVKDVLAAYDFLCVQKNVDPKRIGASGSSYGCYLLALASAKRKFAWLAFRAPALYPDKGFKQSTAKVITRGLSKFRRTRLGPSDNKVLLALSKFEGALLIVRGERDEDVPLETAVNYRRAAAKAHASYRVLKGADHRLSTDEMRQAFNTLFVKWVSERLKRPIK